MQSQDSQNQGESCPSERWCEQAGFWETQGLGFKHKKAKGKSVVTVEGKKDL